MQTISPFLWFDTEAEEASKLYVSLFPDSRILATSYYGGDSPGQAGSVMVVDFEIGGMRVQAMNAGPTFHFTEAVSFYVAAETQEEIDRLWDALIADGGEPSQCGWLKDRWGLSWQIVPAVLPTLMTDPDPERAGRTMQAMLQMSKLDIAALQAAADGR